MKSVLSITRFLLEAGSYNERLDVLNVAKSAYDQLEVHEKNMDELADIYASTGLAWAHRGLFEKALPYQSKANELRSKAVPMDQLELSWTEVNMANLKASMGQHDEALNYQLRALRNRQIVGGDNFESMKPQGVLYQNIGRHMLLAGRTQEAHIWCHISTTTLTDSQNWAMLA